MSKGIRISIRCQKEIQLTSFLFFILFFLSGCGHNFGQKRGHRSDIGRTKYRGRLTNVLIWDMGVYEENAL